MKKPRQKPLKGTAEALIALVKGCSSSDINSISDPNVIVKQSISEGQFPIPKSDTVFLVEDGAKGLRGSRGYWLDNQGEKLDVPSIPKQNASEFEAWTGRYMEWMKNNKIVETNCLNKRRASQIAFNLSCVPDLESRIPL
jgi:hypothetical protein